MYCWQRLLLLGCCEEGEGGEEEEKEDDEESSTFFFFCCQYFLVFVPHTQVKSLLLDTATHTSTRPPLPALPFLLRNLLLLYALEVS